MRPPHWALLGIDPTDDTRAIKRAYATLLRIRRPDEDIDAFQRLRQAYERALAEAGRGPAKVKVPPAPTGFRPVAPTLPTPPPKADTDHVPPDDSQHSEPLPPLPKTGHESPPSKADDADANPAEPLPPVPPIPKAAEPAPVPQQPAARPDPERIAARLHTELREVPVAEIEVWLDRQDDLLPLALRDHISAALLERVIYDRDFGYARVLTLRQVFGWNDVRQLQRLVALRPGRLNGNAIMQRFRLAEMEAMAPMSRRGALAHTEAPPLPPGVPSHADARPRRRMHPLQVILFAVLGAGVVGVLGVGAAAVLRGVDMSGLFSGNSFGILIVVGGVLIRALAGGGNSNRRR